MVVAGYGPVGRAVAEQLDAAGVAVTIVDLNRATFERQSGLSRHVIHGDICDEATLHAADLEHADALILAVPDDERAVKACAVARRLAPDIFIAARTNFLSKGLLATAAGADEVVVEEVVTAEAMKQAVMKRLLNQ